MAFRAYAALTLLVLVAVADGRSTKKLSKMPAHMIGGRHAEIIDAKHMLALKEESKDCPRGCHCKHNKHHTVERMDCTGIRNDEIPPVKVPGDLHVMVLDKCAITDNVMHGLKRLVNLKVLQLSGNELDDIPAKTFKHLSNLVKLDLSNSDVLTLLKGVFMGLGDLETLDLSHNVLSDMPADTFSSLLSLEFLDLSHNDIMKFKTSIFANLRDLKKLLLNNNHIRSLPKTIFDNLDDLEVLNLGHNYLSTLPMGIFNDLISLKKLNIMGSQLFNLDHHLCSVEQFATNTLGKTRVLLDEDVRDYIKTEKPCSEDCAYTLDCGAHHLCEGTIAKHKCVAKETYNVL